jgi:D-alanyl-lipoteichoic acid acyltransferase DltB (MBOAT superfamily)
VQHARRWSAEFGFDGMMLILEGLFRKCVIADNCALIANAAFGGHFGRTNAPIVLLGMYAFAWQIYADFSAYSDMARGSAQLLGFHFMLNFRQPYLAQTLQDFWRRWHISLSTWLRDYLYISLGGSRSGKWKTHRNLLTTMLLGGLWHGANWTFVVWGAIHGGGLALERGFGIAEHNKNQSWPFAWIRRILLFHLVGLAWIFFRASSVKAAFELIAGLGVWEWRPEYWIALKFVSILSIIALAMDLWLERTGDEYVLQSATFPMRVTAGVCAIALITFFGANDGSAFIYFQF